MSVRQTACFIFHWLFRQDPFFIRDKLYTHAKNLKKITILLLFVLLSTAKGEAEKAEINIPHRVSVYTGIPDLVRLGDPPSVTLRQIKKKSVEVPIESAELQELKIEKILHFPEIGLKVFYRGQKAALILLQEPFNGLLRTSNIKLFPFESAPEGSWEEYLIKKLGKPQWIISGGKLNSKGLFYPWGDIAFNAMGPNQLALYRDNALFKFREKDFGRELELNQTSKQ